MFRCLGESNQHDVGWKYNQYSHINHNLNTYDRKIWQRGRRSLNMHLGIFAVISFTWQEDEEKKSRSGLDQIRGKKEHGRHDVTNYGGHVVECNRINSPCGISLSGCFVVYCGLRAFIEVSIVEPESGSSNLSERGVRFYFSGDGSRSRPSPFNTPLI